MIISCTTARSFEESAEFHFCFSLFCFSSLGGGGGGGANNGASSML